jgi:hypothetical protein
VGSPRKRKAKSGVAMFHLLPADARSIESAEEKYTAREKAHLNRKGGVALYEQLQNCRSG